MKQRSITYLADQDYVWVRTFESYTLASEVDTLQQALEEARRHGCKKLLFDHREARVIAPTLQSYERPGVYKELGFDFSFRVASLVTHICDDLKFYETVCLNRGWKMRIFDDLGTAVNWLNSDAPPERSPGP